MVGVDEVGRGCLAGPVYAAAAILTPLKSPRGLTDSKLLTASRRKILCDRIYDRAQIGVGFASVEEIETLNILQASLLAMKRAVLNLKLNQGLLLVDGNFMIPGLSTFTQVCLTQGELRARPIAAASIVAKVTRDDLMVEKSKEYPGYGFEIHKGYATSKHRQAIQQLGVSAYHRKTFSGVIEHLRTST